MQSIAATLRCYRGCVAVSLADCWRSLSTTCGFNGSVSVLAEWLINDLPLHKRYDASGSDPESPAYWLSRLLSLSPGRCAMPSTRPGSPRSRSADAWIYCRLFTITRHPRTPTGSPSLRSLSASSAVFPSVILCTIIILSCSFPRWLMHAASITHLYWRINHVLQKLLEWVIYTAPASTSQR